MRRGLLDFDMKSGGSAGGGTSGDWITQFKDYFTSDLPQWTGATWTNTAGVISNSPTLGSNILTTGDMETGNPPTGYPAINSGSVAGVADPRTGSAGAQSLEVTRGVAPDAARNISFRAGITNGDWFVMDGWARGNTGSDYARFYLIGSGFLPCTPFGGANATNVWTYAKVSGHEDVVAGGDPYFNILPAGGKGRFDDLTVKKASLPTLFRWATQLKLGAFDVKMTSAISLYTQAGIGTLWNSQVSPTSGIVAYFTYTSSSIKVIVEQCLNGSWTILSSKTFTALSGFSNSITLHIDGTTCKVYFNSTLLDTVTIDASLVGNVNHGLFAIEGSFSSFAICPHVVKKWTIIGDSIPANTGGYGCWLPYSLPGLNLVTNRAVSSAVIIHDGVNTDLQDEVTAAAGDDADNILVAIGVNDPGAGAVGGPFLAQIQALQASNTRADIRALEILPITTNNSGQDAKRALIEAACATAGITYYHTVGWIDPVTDTGDGVHPSVPAGHRKIRDQLVVRY